MTYADLIAPLAHGEAVALGLSVGIFSGLAIVACVYLYLTREN